ncbi:MAG: phospholipase D-like domain-containing protein, partial [bacterium]
PERVIMKEILAPGRNCWGSFEVRETGLLIDGRNYYRAFYHAARRAQRYILIAGWQFDSDVRLLRGADAAEAGGDMRLLPFLKELCRGNPDLAIYILAWDFSVIFSIKREWFQKWIFNWTTNRQLRFRFDNRHAVGASHHQKFVVIDGVLAFVGGFDICAGRWDDRDHRPDNPDRVNSAGKGYELYHDIQTYHVGPAATRLTELFQDRWAHSDGGALDLPPPARRDHVAVEGGIAIAADRVALSRTQSKTLVPAWESISEIRQLFMDAIHGAERLIYIENQYFSSQAVYRALLDRMREQGRGSLQVVIILPQKPHALIEEISLGIAQMSMIHSLTEAAARHGHSLGFYYPSSVSGRDASAPVYVHAKLLLVDDRFLTGGSANISNRSMGLDTELNVSWEATTGDHRALIRSIRRARVSLLAEHAGIKSRRDLRRLCRANGLVRFLDSLADRPRSPLRHHTTKTLFKKASWLKEIKIEDLSLDPERPIVEENIYEIISRDTSGLFAKGITLLRSMKHGHSPDSGGKHMRGRRFHFPLWARFIDTSSLVGHTRQLKWIALFIFMVLAAVVVLLLIW